MDLSYYWISLQDQFHRNGIGSGLQGLLYKGSGTLQVQGFYKSGLRVFKDSGLKFRKGFSTDLDCKISFSKGSVFGFGFYGSGFGYFFDIGLL